MPTISEVREKFPQYQDMPDDQLADALHKKYYADMPREEFNTKIGLQSAEPAAAQPKEERSFAGAVGEGITNIPSSAGRFVEATAQPILHPIETATSFKNLGVGLLQKLGITSGNESEQHVDAVVDFLKKRYGSIDAVKNTIATDPVGLAADLSMVLSLGGGAAVRAPGVVGEIGEAASTVGRALDPLAAAGKGAAAVGGGVSKVAKSQIGGYLTRTGERPLGEAFQAGAEGGEAAKSFQDHLRGSAPIEEVVQEARQAVSAIGKERGEVYRSGMIDVGKDKHILDFQKIDQALKESEKIATYKGINLEEIAQADKVTDVRKRMWDAVAQWRKLDPSEYHTVEGLDALKKSLGLVYKGTERGTPERLVAGKIYNSVKDTIVEQAPAYAKVMKGYDEATDLIQELERELAGKPDKAVGPSLKKLQSVMRNNVHTNYGNREKLAELLVQNGATNLMRKLAGQALSAEFSRGTGSILGGFDLAAGIGAVLLGHPGVLAATLLTLPFMSPRVMGEAAYYAGKFYGGAKQAGQAAGPVLPGRGTEQALFQTGRAAEVAQQPDLSDVVGTQ